MALTHETRLYRVALRDGLALELEGLMKFESGLWRLYVEGEATRLQFAVGEVSNLQVLSPAIPVAERLHAVRRISDLATWVRKSR